jgi:mRNA interferase MazF
VLSAKVYNSNARLVVCCPITSQSKGYPFEVLMPPASAANGGISGVVLADHVKSMDWLERDAGYAGIATPDLIERVRLMIAALLGMPD